MAGGILERLGRALSFLGVSDPAELRRKEEMRRARQLAAAKEKAPAADAARAASRPASSTEARHS